MYTDEIVRRAWTTDEHDSRYVLIWGRPSAWVIGLGWEPPHDSGGCYAYRRDATGALVRVDYTHRSWSIEINLLWRSLYVARVRQRPVPSGGR